MVKFVPAAGVVCAATGGVAVAVLSENGQSENSPASALAASRDLMLLVVSLVAVAAVGARAITARVSALVRSGARQCPWMGWAGMGWGQHNLVAGPLAYFQRDTQDGASDVDLAAGAW